jgi:hypothetical protein
MSDATTDLKRFIRDIPDFPKPGIVFKDITPLLADATAFRAMIDALVAPYRGRADMVLGIESRGFIIGAAAALALGTGIAIVRKPGKLPYRTHRAATRLIRNRHPRDPSRRRRRGPSRPPDRRPARDRRYGVRGHPARRAVQRPGRRVRVRDRARLPRRPTASSAARGAHPHPLRGRLTGAAVAHRDHAGETTALRSSLAVTAGLCIAELVGGWWTNSLALLTDAAHMFTDVARA